MGDRRREVPRRGRTGDGDLIPGLGAAAAAGLVVYFLCAAAAHLRARYVGRDFWLNCLGMLVVCIAVLVFCFL